MVKETSAQRRRRLYRVVLRKTVVFTLASLVLSISTAFAPAELIASPWGMGGVMLFNLVIWGVTLRVIKRLLDLHELVGDLDRYEAAKAS